MSLSLDHVFICPEDPPAAESALTVYSQETARDIFGSRIACTLLHRLDAAYTDLRVLER
jgi:hypothetical protein